MDELRNADAMYTDHHMRPQARFLFLRTPNTQVIFPRMLLISDILNGSLNSISVNVFQKSINVILIFKRHPVFIYSREMTINLAILLTLPRNYTLTIPFLPPYFKYPTPSLTLTPSIPNLSNPPTPLTTLSTFNCSTCSGVSVNGSGAYCRTWAMRVAMGKG